MKKSILFLCIALSGCVSYTNQKPSVYQYGLAQTEMQVKYATIESIREVYIQDQKTGIGTGAGAGVAGNAKANPEGAGAGAGAGRGLGSLEFCFSMGTNTLTKFVTNAL